MPESHTSLSPDQIAELLAPFRIRLTDEQLRAISTYVDLLTHWNRVVSLTAIEDPSEIIVRHFGESIFASTVVDLRSGRLADVGTGAGFPGLALKIALPDLEVTLLEPNRRKCAFLSEICGVLRLSGVEIERKRFEEFSPPDKLDYVCARSLGSYRGLLRWAGSVLRPGGRVVLWLGIDDSTRISRTPGWIWDLPVLIPGSRRRVVLSGRLA